jgi:hypothetical protein
MVRLFRSAAIAAAVATAACGGAAKTLTAPSQPPTSSSLLGPTAVLAIRTDAKPALGLLGGSLTFDASESLGSGLTYSIEFGDGEKTVKISEAHLLKSAGAKTAKLTVTDSLGRASSAEVEYFVALIQEPSTAWRSASSSGQVTMSLSQVGAQISGLYYESGSATGNRTLLGSVTGDRRLSLHTEDGRLTVDGSLEWAADSSQGCLTQSCVRLRSTVHGGMFDGRVADFSTTPLSGQSPVARLALFGDTQPIFGLMNYTAFAFDASGSTGDGLTYDLNFGDGEVSAERTAVHVTRACCGRNARLVVTDIMGRSNTAEVRYAAFDLTGGSVLWRHYESSRQINIAITSQVGERLSGSYVEDVWYGGGQKLLVGTLSGARAFELHTADGSVSITGQFELAPGVTASSRCFSPSEGPLIGCLQMRASIRGGIANGLTWIFSHYDPY